jgi:hypothetical protein
MNTNLASESLAMYDRHGATVWHLGQSVFEASWSFVRLEVSQTQTRSPDLESRLLATDEPTWLVSLRYRFVD